MLRNITVQQGDSSPTPKSPDINQSDKTLIVSPGL